MKRGFFITLFALAAVLTSVALAAPPVSAQTARGASTHEMAAQASRPRVTIFPRQKYPGRNAKRQCRANLVQEVRASGTVIVPKMQCWWQ